MNKDIHETLKERGKTHGDFEEQAHIAQMLKDIIRPYISGYTDDKKEALDMTMHKIARICAGDPNERDHWHDIAGYSTLVCKVIDSDTIVGDSDDRKRR